MSHHLHMRPTAVLRQPPRRDAFPKSRLSPPNQLGPVELATQRSWQKVRRMRRTLLPAATEPMSEKALAHFGPKATFSDGQVQSGRACGAMLTGARDTTGCSAARG